MSTASCYCAGELRDYSRHRRRGEKPCAASTKAFAAYRRERSHARHAERHAGHDVITARDGRPYCRSCKRGDLDIDEVAVERAVAGDPPEHLTPAEREAAVMRLVEAGLSNGEIAARFGCHRKTIWQIRMRVAGRRQREESAA